MIVIDASYVLTRIMPDETPAATPPSSAGVAPTLLWAEVRNAFLVAERRQRLTASEAEELVATFDSLGIVLDTEPRSDVVMALARRHSLTAYDALYLELALRKGADLATLDRTLAEAARAEGVRVFGAPD